MRAIRRFGCDVVSLTATLRCLFVLLRIKSHVLITILSDPLIESSSTLGWVIESSRKQRQGHVSADEEPSGTEEEDVCVRGGGGGGGRGGGTGFS